jgi:hypothetical protein
MLVTNDYRWDGFGAQYQNIIWSILWAECNGHTFYYSDIERMLVGGSNKPANIENNSKVDPAYLQMSLLRDATNEEEQAFIKQALECMNLKGKYPGITTVPPNSVVFSLKAPYFFKDVERDMERFHNSPSFQKIQAAFFANKTSPFDDEHFHIAVHVRRPLSFDIRVEGTNTKDLYYLRCMETILKSHQGGKPLLFHIYSQGKEEDFELYNAFPIQLHLQDDTFLTFKGMVYADILITSASSYSYVAGLLSKGSVVYLPFWHPPRKHWYII